MQFIALIVIIISLIAIAYRDLKMAMVSLAAVLVAALLFYYLSPAETPGSKGKQILSDLSLTQTQVGRGYADGFVLELRIQNNNRETTLENFTIVSRLSDCKENKTECLVIGEEKSVLKLRLPPGQARDARINLRIKQINPVQGSAFWEHTIIDAK